MQQRLYLWYDVENELRERRADWPNNWADIDVTTSNVTIRIAAPDSTEAERAAWDTLGQIFAERCDCENARIMLDALPEQERFLPVFLEFDPQLNQRTPAARPLFAVRTAITAVPQTPAGAPPVFAFYSYKGGVGRTLSLLTVARAIIARRLQEGREPRLLLIDADYEAPGLTWLARDQGGFRDFSQLDALALVHAADDWQAEALPLICARVQEELLRIPVEGRITEHYFIPAFRYERQLLDLPVQPQHLLQMPGRQWVLGDLLLHLGQQLAVDAVLIDLRAGISELAAPLLLDPRIHRFLVSSTSKQSVEGVELILKHLNRQQRVPSEQKREPSVLLSMVPVTLDWRTIDQIQARFQRAYPIESDGSDEKDDLLTPSLSVVELPFSDALVHLDGLKDVDDKLTGTSMESNLRSFVSDILERPEEVPRTEVDQKRKAKLRALQELCAAMAKGELEEGAPFLQTLSLRTLAQKFASAPPVAVVMGAKGAGKSFIYNHLLASATWNQFRQQVLPAASTSSPKIEVLGLSIPLVPGDQDLQRAWLQEMAHRLGLPQIESDPLPQMQRHLDESERNVAFVVDGLEERFRALHERPAEQEAIRSLCQGVMERLQSLPKRRIGLIIFIRPDTAETAMGQGFAPLRSAYESFELRWSPDEALQLVLWIAWKAGLLLDKRLKPADIPMLNRSIIKQKLEPLWGRKIRLTYALDLEADTANWILIGLSDFHGQLPARDIVRFLHQAATESLAIPKTDKAFQSDRLLQVGGIKKAIRPCGEAKVQEMGRALPALQQIFDKMAQPGPWKHAVPFQRADFDLLPGDVAVLIRYGILTEHELGYFTPEIYRQGLHLNLAEGARARIAAILRRTLRLEH